MSGAMEHDRAVVDRELFGRFGIERPAGTVLFREGDFGAEMYVIHEGKVALSRQVRGKEQHLATLPPGEFFGEMSIINDAPRTATATVLENARLLAIDGQTFEAMIRGNAEIALRLIKKLAGRVAQANEQVEVLLLRDVNHRVVHMLHHMAASVGVSDGVGVRLDVAVDELARQVGLPSAEVLDCLERLERARLVHRDLGSILVAEVGKLDDFLELLELKERFGAE